MARASAAVAEAAADEEPREIDYESYKGKQPTDLQSRLEVWLREKCDIDPARDFKTKEQAWAEGVRLAVALRIPFQASPENRRDTEAARARREAEKASRQSAGEEETAPAPVPARRGRPAKAAPAPAADEQPQVAKPSGRRGARRAPATDRPAAF